MPKPKAYDSSKERKREQKETKEILSPTVVLWGPHAYRLTYRQTRRQNAKYTRILPSYYSFLDLSDRCGSYELQYRPGVPVV